MVTLITFAFYKKEDITGLEVTNVSTNSIMGLDIISKSLDCIINDNSLNNCSGFFKELIFLLIKSLDLKIGELDFLLALNLEIGKNS